jgi:hypothetical protein
MLHFVLLLHDSFAIVETCFQSQLFNVGSPFTDIMVNEVDRDIKRRTSQILRRIYL